MNIQHAPRRSTPELTEALNEIDRVTGQQLAAPSYGEDQRKVIDTCVESIVSDLCRRMEDLHGQLKTIEQQVLASAERARNALREHAAVCVRVNDEIKAMHIVISDLAEQSRATAQT